MRARCDGAEGEEESAGRGLLDTGLEQVGGLKEGGGEHAGAEACGEVEV